MTDIDASAELFSQAAVLLLAGMVFVFAFLTLLIIVIKVVISPLGSRFPDPVIPVNNARSQTFEKSSDEPSATLAAIGAAVHKYRQKHK